MIPNSCISIETKKFPILAGEKEELVNPNMYGKALCKYLEENLPKVGLKVPFFCVEDWGWWLEVEDGQFKMGLCIYSDPNAENDPEKYAILPSIEEEKQWFWFSFGYVDVSMNVLKIIDSLENMFRSDTEITKIARHDDFPF